MIVVTLLWEYFLLDVTSMLWYTLCLYVDYVFHCKYADGVAYPYIGLYMHCALTIYALQHRDGYMQLGASTILPQQPIVWCVNQNPIKINNLFAQEYKAKKWNTQNLKGENWKWICW